jgi:hypothetical protein
MQDCPPCQRFIESLRRTVALLGREPAPALTDEIRAEVRQALDGLRRERGA